MQVLILLHIVVFRFGSRPLRNLGRFLPLFGNTICLALLMIGSVAVLYASMSRASMLPVVVRLVIINKKLAMLAIAPRLVERDLDDIECAPEATGFLKDFVHLRGGLVS